MISSSCIYILLAFDPRFVGTWRKVLELHFSSSTIELHISLSPSLFFVQYFVNFDQFVACQSRKNSPTIEFGRRKWPQFADFVDF